MEAVIPKPVRVRIAPSPTGFLHVGTARTALFNFLFARKNGGVFIVRIEDTDTGRSEKRFEDNIIEGLTWLGLTWDEGPDTGGSYGPYRQSERKDLYRTHLESLLERNLAYHCFCTKEDLEAQKNYMIASGIPPKYSGQCGALEKDDVARRITGGVPSVIRFKTPTRKLSFIDVIKGKIEVDTELIGDFTIAKSVEEPLYNFTAAVDDELMEISHVIRGEDHISNTPKQILIQEALGFHAPSYAHLPLILGPDKSKLSKRHGATSILEYRDEGYLPEALANFLALLGWHPGDEREFYSLEEISAQFDLSTINKSNAVFNIQKLDWFNAHYIRQKSDDDLCVLCLPYLTKVGLVDASTDTEKVKKIIALEKDRLKKLSDIVPLSEFFFSLPEYETEMLVWKKSDAATVAKSLAASYEALAALNAASFTKEAIKSALDTVVTEFGTGATYWPVRVALSGKDASPGPVEIAEILGKEEVIKRIHAGVTRLNIE
ncbi:MAG: glutamate--tRNA ligase [Candidatus Azambacteria bacterium]|nr:glutamate--tRNA ligase [Candidatus Azambacteria bacterium]